MNLSLLISDIIEKFRCAPNKTQTKTQIDHEFATYFEIFGELRQIEIFKDLRQLEIFEDARQLLSKEHLRNCLNKLNSAFLELSPELTEYLLEFIVIYFEIGTPNIFKFFTFWESSMRNNSTVIRTVFGALYNRITKDTYKSDNHILAYMYLTYLGSLYDFERCFCLSAIEKENNIFQNGDDKTLSLKHVETRDKFSSTFTKNILKLGEKNDDHVFVKFCFNNKKLSMNKSLHLTDNIGCVRDAVSIELSVDAIKEIEESFLYNILGVYQLLRCINSSYFLSCQLVDATHHNQKKGVNIKNKLIIMMCKWIKKYPECVRHVNSNVKLCPNAFLVLCIFKRDNEDKVENLRKRQTSNICINKDDVNILFVYDLIHEFFNKDGWCGISEYFVESQVKNVQQYRALELCMNILASKKTIDDDFILEILYNGTYKKAFSNFGSKFLCQGGNNNHKGVWLDMSFKNLPDAHINVYHYQNRYLIKYDGFKINCIDNRVLVRPNMCLALFTSVFGMDYKVSMHIMDGFGMPKLEISKAKDALKSISRASNTSFYSKERYSNKTFKLFSVNSMFLAK